VTPDLGRTAIHQRYHVTSREAKPIVKHLNEESLAHTSTGVPGILASIPLLAMRDLPMRNLPLEAPETLPWWFMRWFLQHVIC